MHVAPKQTAEAVAITDTSVGANTMIEQKQKNRHFQ